MLINYSHIKDFDFDLESIIKVTIGGLKILAQA